LPMGSCHAFIESMRQATLVCHFAFQFACNCAHAPRDSTPCWPAVPTARTDSPEAELKRPKRPPLIGFSREIEMLAKRDGVVGGDSPGIDAGLDFLSTNEACVLAAAVVAAQPEGHPAV
jgi:hypothetical protein